MGFKVTLKMKTCNYCHKTLTGNNTGYCNSSCKNKQGQTMAHAKRERLKEVSGLVQHLICTRWSKIKYNYEAVI